MGSLGAAWGWLVLHELSDPDSVRGLDLLGTATFVTGLTGLVYGISKGGISGWNDPLVIGGLVASAVLLPAFVLIEHRGRAPMLDLDIFRNRLFAAATAAAFINGLSRFALMFLFVFYFQGAQGDDPITAGVKFDPDGDRDAHLLTGGRRLGGPARLAHPRRAGDARGRRRAGGDDDAPAGQPLLAEHALAAASSASAPACSTRPTPRR